MTHVPAVAPSAWRRGHPWRGIVLTLRSPYLLAVAAYLFCMTLGSTFLYFQQAHIVDATLVDREARAALFARLDLWVNLLTVLCQALLTGGLIRRLGIGATLAAVPLLTVAGFATLGLAPVLPVLAVFMVLQRVGRYGIIRPARETLFTVLPLEMKYKAKNFLDTFVYRGGDALGATAFAALAGLGLGLSALAFVAVPVALVWVGLGLHLGRRQQELARNLDGAPPPGTRRHDG